MAVVRQILEPVEDVRVFELEPSCGVVRYPLGSHIEVAVQVGGLRAIRCYSLVGEAAAHGAYRIAVKRIADGRGGSLFMWGLTSGASLRISEPRSHFQLRAGCPEYLLIAGGIGITPLFGMAEALARRAARFRLLYAGRQRSHMAFLPELSARLGDRLSVYVDDEGTFLDLPAELQQLDARGELYVCGPIGLMESARRAWHGAARPADGFRLETFGSSGHLGAQPFEVEVTDHGCTVSVPRDRSLLDVLAAAGIDVPGHCRRGECGLCAVHVVEVDGALDHRDIFLSDEQKALGRTLCPCVSRAVGRIAIDTGFRAAL
jgi:vanillate O-demethylase ferredoxin subunit